MRRDCLSGQPVCDARGSGEVEAVAHAQERDLAIHRHHGKLWHVLAVRNDDAEPVAPAGYGEVLRPDGRVLPRCGVPTHGEKQNVALAHGIREIELPVGDDVAVIHARVGEVGGVERVRTPILVIGLYGHRWLSLPSSRWRVCWCSLACSMALLRCTLAPWARKKDFDGFSAWCCSDLRSLRMPRRCT